MQQSRNSIDRLTSWCFWLYFAAWSFYFISFFNLSSQLRHDRSVQNVFLIKKDILESFSPSTRQWCLVVHRASKNAIFEQENDEQNSFLNFFKGVSLNLYVPIYNWFNSYVLYPCIANVMRRNAHGDEVSSPDRAMMVEYRLNCDINFTV